MRKLNVMRNSPVLKRKKGPEGNRPHKRHHAPPVSAARAADFKPE
jgi:hypothetical protein